MKLVRALQIDSSKDAHAAVWVQVSFALVHGQTKQLSCQDRQLCAHSCGLD